MLAARLPGLLPALLLITQGETVMAVYHHWIQSRTCLVAWRQPT